MNDDQAPRTADRADPRHVDLHGAPTPTVGGTMSGPIVRFGVRIAGLVLVVRLVLLAWGDHCLAASPYSHGQTRMMLWSRWDGQAYLALARDGYAPARTGHDAAAFNARFPPLYPWLIRGLAALTPLSLEATGVLLSTGALLGASWLLFTLVMFEGQSTTVAWWAVVFLNLHPGSYFGHGVFSESLFLGLTIAYFHAVRRLKRFDQAAMFVSAALLTRVAALPLLLLHVGLGLRRLQRAIGAPKRDVPGTALLLFWTALPVATLLGFFATTHLVLSLPGYAHPNRSPLLWGWPLAEMYETATHLPDPATYSHPPAMWLRVWPQGMLLVSIMVVAAGVRCVATEYVIYGATYLLMLSCMRNNISCVRLCFGLFVPAMVLGQVSPRLLRALVALLSAAALLYFCRVYVYWWHMF